MSIATRTGDQGTTALMYNRRVSKCDERVEAYGAVDELNAALGLARAAGQNTELRDLLTGVQKNLVSLMGELATTAEDLQRYIRDGHAPVGPSMTLALDQHIRDLESGGTKFSGWALPGTNLVAAYLDLARTVCRRAERRVCRLQVAQKGVNPEIIVFLNRLSDLLWLLAREAEKP